MAVRGRRSRRVHKPCTTNNSAASIVSSMISPRLAEGPPVERTSNNTGITSSAAAIQESEADKPDDPVMPPPGITTVTPFPPETRPKPASIR